jgi:hypothetical protein
MVAGFECVHKVDLNRDVNEECRSKEDDVRDGVAVRFETITLSTAEEGFATAGRESNRAELLHEDSNVSDDAANYPKFVHEALLLLVAVTLYHKFRVRISRLEGNHPGLEEPLIQLRPKGHQHRHILNVV